MFSNEYHKNNNTDTATGKNNKLFFQPKLTINQPNDVYEQEANTVADKITQQDNFKLNTFFKPTAIQRKQDDNEQGNASPQTENYISNLSGGNALTSNEKSFFESRLGYDFSNVRIHTNSSADQSAKSINALAYTSGNNIVFASNQYKPGTPEGNKLLAHELTHVIQQSNSTSSLQTIQRDIA